jgi:hypothetical protein
MSTESVVLVVPATLVFPLHSSIAEIATSHEISSIFSRKPTRKYHLSSKESLANPDTAEVVVAEAVLAAAAAEVVAELPATEITERLLAVVSAVVEDTAAVVPVVTAMVMVEEDTDPVEAVVTAVVVEEEVPITALPRDTAEEEEEEVAVLLPAVGGRCSKGSSTGRAENFCIYPLAFPGSLCRLNRFHFTNVFRYSRSPSIVISFSSKSVIGICQYLLFRLLFLFLFFDCLSTACVLSTSTTT